MSCDVYALLLQKAPPRLSQCTGLPLPWRLFYTSLHQFQEVRMNAPCLKLFCHYYFLYQEMAKSFTHPIWDALFSFRSIDLEEFFTTYPVISIFQWKKRREEGRKERI